MSTGAARSPPATKKSRRSTSPRAVELRKLQNRIAQRNHRRRVRESAQAQQQSASTSIAEETQSTSQQSGEDEDCRTQDPIEQQLSVASASSQPKVQIASHDLAQSGPYSLPLEPPTNHFDNMIMADDMTAQHEQNLPYVELMMRNMPDKESRRSQTSIPPQGCTCNTATGPCPYHLEKLRLQILSETVSPFQTYQQHHQHQQNQSMSDLDITKPHTLPSSPIMHYSQSTSSSGSSQHTNYPSLGTTRVGQTRHGSSFIPHLSKIPSSIGSHMFTPQNSLPAPLTDVPMDQMPSRGGAKTTTTSAADNTRRFSVMLEAMKTAGFQDFETMVLEYYTARFEGGSNPSMAQCASRSRRLKAMLQDLQERSSQWPRWEARGFHESISEATTSLCLEEMERWNKAQMLNHALLGEPVNIITAFEWLLETGGHGNTSILEELGIAGNVDAAPGEMPYLWSFLTELAGPRGLYCDRIARVLMVILLYARRT